MCLDPVTMAIIGGASLALGTGANMISTGQRNRATAEAIRRNADTRDRYSNEAIELWKKSLEGVDAEGAPDLIDAKANKRLRQISDYTDTTNFDPTLPGNAARPQVVQTEAARALAGALATMQGRIAALAKMGGFGDRTSDRLIELGRTNEQLQNLGIFGQGADAVLQANLAAAQAKGSGLGFVGDLLTGIGQIGVGYGLSGMGAGTGAPATAGTPQVILPPAMQGGRAAYGTGARQLNEILGGGVW